MNLMHTNTTAQGTPGIQARRAHRWLTGALACLLAACQSAPSLTEVSVNPAPQEDGALRRSALLRPASGVAAYTLQPGDELDLRFADYPQYDQSLKVRPDGRITVQVIGSVYVLGRTPEDVQAELLERYQSLTGGAGERQYLIHPGDELDIKFAYQNQFNEQVKVRPDGKIALQLVGSLQAQGLSPEELQAELVKRYQKVLRQPELVVIMRSFSSQALRVTGQGGAPLPARAGAEFLRPVLIVKSTSAPQVFVGGEVQRPGVLAWRPGLTLVQALTEAGGQLPTAALQGTLVLRKAAGREPLVIHTDLRPDMNGSGSNDVALEASDVVVLPRTAVASLAQTLDQYVYKLIPLSFGFSYDLRGNRTN
jgi:polysaccharide export outer membrane protein